MTNLHSALAEWRRQALYSMILTSLKEFSHFIALTKISSHLWGVRALCLATTPVLKSKCKLQVRCMTVALYFISNKACL